MKLEEGMYVRTISGDIEKIEKWSTDITFRDENGFIDFVGHIKKASYNIIDLIDFGDMINNKIIGKYRGNLGVFAIYENCWKFVTIEDYIKENSFFLDIVTKEQLGNIGYKVKL